MRMAASGRRRAGFGVEPAERCAKRRKLLDDFGEAHDRELFGGRNPLETGFREPRSSHSEGRQVRPLPAQRCEQARAVEVSGGLARGDEEVHGRVE